MIHLLNSVVAVYRQSAVREGGKSRIVWVLQDSPLDAVPCRLDLTFVRRGKDMPSPTVTAAPPDRMGVLFFPYWIDLKPADHLVAIPNARGEIPISGKFEIRAVPDVAQGFSSAHHKEVQVFEISQSVAGIYPGVDS